MRIGLVSPYALGEVGGVQGQVCGLAIALMRRGHDVVVAAPDPTGPVARELRSASVTLLDGGRTVGFPANGSVAPISLSPLASMRIRRGFINAAVEVIHCHEPLAPMASYATVLAPPVPLVATFHRAGGGPILKLLAPVRPLLGHQIAQSFAVSNAAKEFAHMVTTASPQVLFNGMDLQGIDRAEPISADGPTILFLGRHETRKGLQVLLEAHAPMEAVTLLIAGTGPETGSLMDRYPEAVHRHWLGRLSESDKYAYLRGADITCAPSLGGESFGVIVLEALAARSIAVVADLPGYREAAAGHAVLTTPGDVVALRNALAGALQAMREGSGVASVAAKDASRAHAQTWSLDALAARYEAAYLEVTRNARR